MSCIGGRGDDGISGKFCEFNSKYRIKNNYIDFSFVTGRGMPEEVCSALMVVLSCFQDLTFCQKHFVSI